MYADKRASRVGDLITIVVQENTTATKDIRPQPARRLHGCRYNRVSLYRRKRVLTKGGNAPGP